MIHATVCGVLVADAEFWPSYHEPGVSRHARANFTISTRKYVENAQHVQVITCALRGQRATALHRYLVLGKRVIVNGDLVLLSGARLHMNVRTIELIGGGQHQGPETEADDAAG